MKLPHVLSALILFAFVAGCGPRVIKTDNDAAPAYRLDDGSLCEAPQGYPDILHAPGTLQVRVLFLSSTSPAVTAESVTDLPSREEIDAALYLSCGEFAAGKLSTDVFTRQRRIYQELRLRHLERGIQRWLNNPQGFESSGKVCHFMFSGGSPDTRDVTRLVPQETSVDDCALRVRSKGGTHVLLGCSAGQWKLRWARQPILAGANGWDNRRDPIAGTRYVPDPDCGWG